MNKLSVTMSTNLYIAVVYKHASKHSSSNTSSSSSVSILCRENDNLSYIENTTATNFSNQKLELCCIEMCLDVYRSFKEINIFSKSLYAVNSVNVWSSKWKEEGWKRIGRRNGDNIEIVRNILDRKTELESTGTVVNITHVAKHERSILSKNSYTTAQSILASE